MNGSVPVAVFGGEAVMAAIATLGYEISDSGDVAIIEISDEAAVARAAGLATYVPRILVAPPERHDLLRAAGASPALLVTRADPALLGPLVSAARPKPTRAPTRVLTTTGTSGGIGRTLLAANLAMRLARRDRVIAIDATGSGALGWWLGVEGAPWSELEGLAHEMSPDHIPVIARESPSGVKLIGGGVRAPSDALVSAAVRATRVAADVVIVDAPPLFASTTQCLLVLSDRVLMVTSASASARGVLESAGDLEWVIATQTNTKRIADRDVFACLPRDDGAVVVASARRSAVGGRLGHAYDDLAELILVDMAPR